jgi:hypothetical protein
MLKAKKNLDCLYDCSNGFITTWEFDDKKPIAESCPYCQQGKKRYIYAHANNYKKDD